MPPIEKSLKTEVQSLMYLSVLEFCPDKILRALHLCFSRSVNSPALPGKQSSVIDNASYNRGAPPVRRPDASGRAQRCGRARVRHAAPAARPGRPDLHGDGRWRDDARNDVRHAAGQTPRRRWYTAPWWHRREGLPGQSADGVQSVEPERAADLPVQRVPQRGMERNKFSHIHAYHCILLLGFAKLKKNQLTPYLYFLVWKPITDMITWIEI